jgi:formamidopyrimidine-DNA glycosylase
MPELPEVETVVRELRPLLRRQRIGAVRVGPKSLRFPWQSGWTRRLLGRRIADVRRRGKWIVFDLDDGAGMLAHLGMTGQFRVVSASAALDQHTHVVVGLGRGRELRYRDVRRFGSIRYCANAAEMARRLPEKLGPEPWDLDPAAWFCDLRRRRRCLKAILLDQTVVAGVGNIYADEALFLARLSPRQRGSVTTRPQAERLRRAVLRVMEQAIAARGSTIRDYVGGSGRRGGYQHELLAYGRSGEPCSSCAAVIQCIRLAGRSTHYCPTCQASRSRARN